MDAGAQTLLVCLLAAIGAAALGFKRPVVVGTTLTAVWWWQLVAMASIAGAAGLLFAAYGDALFSGVGVSRYAACSATICPLMALLGAKRPQSKAWVAIVAALWVILTLPGIQAAIYRSGGEVVLDPVRGAFFVVLILIGIVNWLPTRAALPHVLQSCGQIAMLAPFLPRNPIPLEGPTVGLFGLALYAAGLALWNPFSKTRRAASRPLNRAWLDFRDAYGLVWGVRVLDRFNHEGVRHGWKIRLGWRGLRSLVPGASTELSPEIDQRMRKLMRSLLRPFVSRAWLDERAPHAA